MRLLPALLSRLLQSEQKHTDAWLVNRRQWTTEWVLPTTPQRLVDRQRSRAYVGQFSADGELFYGGAWLPNPL